MVIIEMENGKQIKLELYPEKAPITVENFLKLVSAGFYKKIDLITLSSLEQSPALSSETLFRENVNKEKVKLYDVA